MRNVFLYAGQGSQKAMMGIDIYEAFNEYREVVDNAKVICGSSNILVKDMMHKGSLEEISKTENTQPCMATFAAGVTKVLKANGIMPDATCGLSLGEYGALYAAGVFDEMEYINLTAHRGKVMADAASDCKCSMSAILGTDAKTVEEGCKECREVGYVTVANYNCSGQYVICGEENAVEATEKRLKEMGAKRCVRLNVSGPFHTKYMASAGEKLKEYFGTKDWNKPTIPVVMNVTGDFLKEDDNLKELMVKQVQSSVRFEESIKKLLDSGAVNFIEIGPGNVLSGFVRKTAKESGKEVNIYNIDSADSLKNILEKGDEINGK